MLLNERKHELNNELPNRNINLKVVMNILKVKDIRTVINWCKRNGIFIFKIGKEKYVNKIELELGIDKPFIESLKIKHPENWKEIYCAFKEGDYFAILDQNFQKDSISKLKFVAPGNSGNDFIKKIANKKR
ncbi:MAG: hypothetical protein Q8K60_08795 [Parachlamydiaceae bacterium]|nr:hypothetical protein [Parachlamydiaceae bacterium]